MPSQVRERAAPLYAKTTGRRGGTAVYRLPWRPQFERRRPTVSLLRQGRTPAISVRSGPVPVHRRGVNRRSPGKRAVFLVMPRYPRSFRPSQCYDDNNGRIIYRMGRNTGTRVAVFIKTRAASSSSFDCPPLAHAGAFTPQMMNPPSGRSCRCYDDAVARPAFGVPVPLARTDGPRRRRRRHRHIARASDAASSTPAPRSPRSAATPHRRHRGWTTTTTTTTRLLIQRRPKQLGSVYSPPVRALLYRRQRARLSSLSLPLNPLSFTLGHSVSLAPLSPFHDPAHSLSLSLPLSRLDLPLPPFCAITLSLSLSIPHEPVQTLFGRSSPAAVVYVVIVSLALQSGGYTPAK